MSKRTLFTIGLLAGFAGFAPAQSNLFIDSTITPEQMVMDFFDGSGVSVSNVQAFGVANQFAFFEAANTQLGIPAGILLTTGDALFVKGPNDSNSGGVQIAGSTPDADLAQTTGGGSAFDLVNLEFDFVPSVDDTLFFTYSFASEEYCEYVNSQFNDVFGFFISGPGITGPFSGGSQNMARVPGTNDYVGINSVNHLLNTAWFRSNLPAAMNNCQPLPDDGFDAATFQSDGFTTVLTTPFIAMAGQTYHAKIKLADMGDGVLDSGVFLGINSLSSDSLLTPPAIIDALFSNPNTVDLSNLSRYATSWHWDFGDGTTSDERNPGSHFYPLKGDYTITLTTQNWCCSDTTKVVVNILETSASTQVFESKFRLSPNPATDRLRLQSIENQAFEWQIFNLAGQPIRNGQAVFGATEIDLENWATGFYVVEIQTAGGLFQQRFLKK